MKTSILLVVFLGGCSLIPSKWDTNQASMVVNARIQTEQIDCTKNPTASLSMLEQELNWLHVYSDYKGTQDLSKMTDVVQQTVKVFKTQVDAMQSNIVYCNLKKDIIIKQIDIIGHTFKGSLQ
jgi:hypothetical protein